MNVRALGIAALSLLVLAPGAGAQITGGTANPAKPAASAPAAPAPSAQAPAKPAGDPVVGKVNGIDIRLSEVDAAIAELPAQYRDLPRDTLFTSVLQQIVDRHLISAAAAKGGFDKDPEVQKRIAEARDRVLQQAFLNKAVDADVTDAKVKATYDDMLKKMPPQEEVRARHILVKTEDEAKAIAKEIAGGADFAKLADEKSADGGAKNGGDLGYFTREQMVSEFSDAAFKLKKGEVSAPVKSAFGWHVIKLEDRRTVQPPPLDQVREDIRNQLAQGAIARTIDDLRKDAKIETFNPDGTPAAAPAPAKAP